jgi:hypothetical protein
LLKPFITVITTPITLPRAIVVFNNFYVQDISGLPQLFIALETIFAAIAKEFTAEIPLEIEFPRLKLAPTVF